MFVSFFRSLFASRSGATLPEPDEAKERFAAILIITGVIYTALFTASLLLMRSSDIKISSVPFSHCYVCNEFEFRNLQRTSASCDRINLVCVRATLDDLKMIAWLTEGNITSNDKKHAPSRNDFDFIRFTLTC